MKNTLRILICLTLSAQNLNAQLQPSQTTLDSAFALREREEYKQAIALLKDVPMSDSNYYPAIYQTAYCLYLDTAYSEALSKVRLGTSHYSEYQFQFMNLEGNILDEMKRYDEALAAYRACIREYPDYTYPYTNLATTLMNQNRFDTAEAMLKNVLLAFPLSSIAHYKMGYVALKQGKIIQAYMSFACSLLVEPEGQFSAKCIEFMHKLATGNETLLAYMDGRKYEPDANYANVEAIFLSRAALEKGYTTGTDLDEAMMKQLYMISDKLEYRDDDPDHWVQFYLPLYKKIIREKQAEPFFYQLLLRLDVQQIKDYQSKHKKDLVAFRSSCYDYLNPIRATRKIRLSERTLENTIYYYEDGALIANGKKVDGKHVGEWTYFQAKGRLKARGMYNADDKRQGLWKFYHQNGNLATNEPYVNGELDGEVTSFYSNGAPNLVSQYKNGKKNGAYSDHYSDGVLKSRYNYVNDKENGDYRTFHANGSPSLEMNSKDDQADGPYKKYHANGRLAAEGNVVLGKQEGRYRSYHDNGTLESEGEMKNGEMEGEWRSYHTNGRLHMVHSYTKGVKTGEEIEYHDNGRLFYRAYYGKKGQEGSSVLYDRDSTEYAVFTYKDGTLVQVINKDRSGAVISTTDFKGKATEWNAYRADGLKFRTSTINDKGANIGSETYYFGSGKVSSEFSYKDNAMEGPYTNYFTNGQKRSTGTYEGGKKNGAEITYTPHGTILRQGYFVDDQQEGTWYEYDALGRLVSRAGYTEDSEDGFKELFYPNGVREMITHSTLGGLDSLVQFDTTGRMIRNTSLPMGNGVLEIMQINGKPFSKATYEHGLLTGKFQSIFPDGKPAEVKYFWKGIADSILTSYHSNGKLELEGRYERGKKVGTWKTYYSTGALALKEEYVKGLETGTEIWYHENGKVSLEIPYVNGKRDGWQKRYSPNGDFMYQIHVHDEDILEYAYLDKDGKMLPPIPLKGGTGKLNAFYPNGKPAASLTYLDNQTHGTSTRRMPDGTKIFETTYDHDFSEGVETEWYPDGKVSSTETYWHNLRMGLTAHYHPNGKLRDKGEYVLGSKHGTWEYYDETGKLIRKEIYYHGRVLEINKP